MIIMPQSEVLIPIPLTVGMKGFLRVRILRPDGRARWDSGFFPNKILDSGRNNLATQSSWLTWCHVGTGSTPPTASDTQLENFVVATNTVVANIASTQGSAPHYGWRRKTFRYAVGAGHGGQNLSEAGIGWGSAGSVLVSRALIIDPDTQLPTTVTPLADELLEVTYELRYYPPLSDVLNSVTLNGVNYDTITRAANVTDAIWSDNIGSSIGILGTNTSYWKVYDGNIGTITQLPSGNAANTDDTLAYNVSYANNSYQRRMVCPTGPAGWNLGAGIRSAAILTKAGAYQTQFNANPGGTRIPKNSGFTMVLEWILGWTEYV